MSFNQIALIALLLPALAGAATDPCATAPSSAQCAQSAAPKTAQAATKSKKKKKQALTDSVRTTKAHPKTNTHSMDLYPSAYGNPTNH